MSANVKLYFWALVAKEPNQSKITRLKEEAAHRFHSSRALRSPAHITLIPPLRLSPAQLESLQEDFCEVALCTPPFNLDLTGVNGFPERVVYIHVHPLHSQCVLYSYNYFLSCKHPIITIVLVSENLCFLVLLHICCRNYQHSMVFYFRLTSL